MDYSLALGILGVVVALYQGFEKRKLSRYLRSQAWYIYSMSLASWGSAQVALKQYKAAYSDNVKPEIIESLANCDAYNFSLSLEAIRQIQLSEPRFDIESITTWAAQGKIPKDHAPSFMRILSLEPSNIISLLWDGFKLKLRLKLHKKMVQQAAAVHNAHNDSKIKDEVRKP